MKYQDFCELNNVVSTDILKIIDQAIFPDEEFSLEFTMVLYSLDGVSPIVIDNEEHVVRRKCIGVWKPGRKINFKPAPQHKYKVLIISGTLQERLDVGNTFITLFVTNNFPIIRITSAYNESLRLFFESMSLLTAIPDNPYKKDCILSSLRSLFYCTSYYVFRSMHIKIGELYKFSQSYPSYENKISQKFIDLVEQHSEHERHLSFYANALDYNPKYLSSLIKRETGRSGQDVIDHYSLFAAMAKLSYGRQSIKEISDQMKFQSQSDFGKFFKRLTGMSPNTYRKMR